jgi:hypothetical protein
MSSCSSDRISMIIPLLPRMNRSSSLAILRHRERKRLLSNGGSHRLGSASRQERSRQAICHLSFVICHSESTDRAVTYLWWKLL